MLVIGLTVALLASLFYNLKLHRRLKAYEHLWDQIEQVADRNQDGSFTINIQHLEEHVEEHAEENFTAHSPVSEPSIRLLDLPDLTNQDGTPPRAA
jgi:hypothetical protein